MNSTPHSQIEFRITKDVPVSDVAELYLGSGWIKPGADTAFIKPMLENTFAVSAAFDGGKLVGMMRALSDGVSDAYMLDLVVSEKHRGNGLGKTILEKLVSHLEKKGIEWIVCIGAPGTDSFYGKTSAKPMKGYFPMRFGDFQQD